MRSWGSAKWLHPFTTPPQEGVFFLRTSQRNSKVVIGIFWGAVPLYVHYFKQMPLDVSLINDYAINFSNSVGGNALRQELQGAGAIPANSGQQVESSKRTRLEPGRYTFSNDVAVW